MTQPKSDKSPTAPPKEPDPIQPPIDYGLDIQMLKDNLARTPAERIKRHQIALDTMQKLRNAKLK